MTGPSGTVIPEVVLARSPASLGLMRAGAVGRYIESVAMNWWSRPVPGTRLDATLRRLVVVFRVLGWLWMILLVALTLVADEGADRSIVIGAAVFATIWTGVTVFVSARTSSLGAWWFVAIDGVAVLMIGSASTLSGAEDLFHGGYLISWIVLAAYAGGRIAAILAATLTTAEQVVVHLIDGKGLVATGGSIIFFIFAYVVGWTVDALRTLDAERAQAVADLTEERSSTARADERVRLADQMHDTVLQTLHALRLNADEPDEVRYLARQQERDLRKAIAILRSSHVDSYRVALLAARDEVEAMYRVEIDPVLRSDVEMSDRLSTIVDAAREAMLNAAKHSGSSTVELFSEKSTDSMIVFVKDRGIGFDVARITPHRGIGRCIDRVQALGGIARVSSVTGQGTECSFEIAIS